MYKKPIGIIGAMKIEVAALIGALDADEAESCGNIVFHKGTLSGVPCVIAQCGPGKVNAAVCALTMIFKYEPRLIINTGVSGGIGKEVKIGSLVIADSCMQHDFDSSAMGDPPATLFIRYGEDETEEIRYLPCDRTAADILQAEAEAIYGQAHRGVIATGDVFVADPRKSRQLGEDYSAKAVEMEGGSIAQVCYMYHVPCAVLRAISDNADDNARVDFPAFVQSSSEKSAELLRRAVNKL